MPLVMMCGFPSSGKTRVAKALEEHLKANTRMKVVRISDETLGLTKDQFQSSLSEKPARAALKAAVEREMSSDVIVIADALNYIKGFRYELFCIARSLKSPHCVVHTVTSMDVSRNWNQNRTDGKEYPSDMFEALLQRFECPDSRSRWDRPLFTIEPEEQIPFEEIVLYVQGEAKDKAKAATASQPLASDTVHDVDRTSQAVMAEILQKLPGAVPGDQISVSFCPEKVLLSRALTMAELRRIKRQFATYCKTHPVEDVSSIASQFIRFINSNLGT
eukprot:m.334931 g.334931  ORF g.334931 m.334931 type:complete len:275 (+) comp17475_c0_seq1:402-1226(+)